jgi:hypothetical protein
LASTNFSIAVAREGGEGESEREREREREREKSFSSFDHLNPIYLSQWIFQTLGSWMQHH